MLSAPLTSPSRQSASRREDTRRMLTWRRSIDAFVDDASANALPHSVLNLQSLRKGRGPAFPATRTAPSDSATSSESANACASTRLTLCDCDGKITEEEASAVRGASTDVERRERSSCSTTARSRAGSKSDGAALRAQKLQCKGLSETPVWRAGNVGRSSLSALGTTDVRVLG